MPKFGFVSEDTLFAIASAIRSKDGISGEMYPSEFAGRIEQLAAARRHVINVRYNTVATIENYSDLPKVVIVRKLSGGMDSSTNIAVAVYFGQSGNNIRYFYYKHDGVASYGETGYQTYAASSDEPKVLFVQCIKNSNILKIDLGESNGRYEVITITDYE